MAGGSRLKGGAAPAPEGASATDLLPEEGAQPRGRRQGHAGAPPSPAGVLPVRRGSSGGSGEAPAKQRLLSALRPCVQGGRNRLLLQVCSSFSLELVKKMQTLCF